MRYLPLGKIDPLLKTTPQGGKGLIRAARPLELPYVPPFALSVALAIADWTDVVDAVRVTGVSNMADATD